MSVNLELVGTAAVSTRYQDVPETIWPDESLGWFTHHFVLELDLKFIAFLLGVDVKKLFDLFESQLRNLSEDIEDFSSRRQNESKQDLIEKLDKNWKELQNNVADVLSTIAEFQSKLREETEKLSQLSDSPIIFPPGNPVDFTLSPRKSYQRIQKLGVMEALDELSEAVKLLANQGVKTVWIEEV